MSKSPTVPITKETHIEIKRTSTGFFTLAIERTSPHQNRHVAYLSSLIRPSSMDRLLRVLRWEGWRQGFDMENLLFDSKRYLAYVPPQNFIPLPEFEPPVVEGDTPMVAIPAPRWIDTTIPYRAVGSTEPPIDDADTLRFDTINLND